MSADELYALGRQIGDISTTRPDITHQVMVGLQDGMSQGPNPTGYGFGELLQCLCRWWRHNLAHSNIHPPIAFNTRSKPSGIGSWKFHRAQ